MDTYLAIASRRDVKSYESRPIPEDVKRRVLDAGRLSGSGSNRQPWVFHVVDDRALLEQLAECVYAASNLLTAAFVVAVSVGGKGPTSFDAGRATQNMLLAAWNDGVAGSPNGVRERERAAELLGLGEGEQPIIVLSFGYPARPRDVEARSAEEWSERADRKPLDEIVRRH